MLPLELWTVTFHWFVISMKKNGALRATCELVNKIETLSDQAKVANGEMQKALALLGDNNATTA